VTVRGANAAVEEIAICAVADVALLMVNELTVISSPNEAAVWPCTQLVPVPVSVAVSVWPWLPLVGVRANEAWLPVTVIVM
jgi:hypothetical protein